MKSLSHLPEKTRPSLTHNPKLRTTSLMVELAESRFAELSDLYESKVKDEPDDGPERLNEDGQSDKEDDVLSLLNSDSGNELEPPVRTD